MSAAASRETDPLHDIKSHVQNKRVPLAIAVDQMITHMTIFSEKLDNIESGVTNIHRDISEVNTKVTVVDNKVEKLAGNLATLENDKILKLENRILEVENDRRRDLEKWDAERRAIESDRRAEMAKMEAERKEERKLESQKREELEKEVSKLDKKMYVICILTGALIQFGPTLMKALWAK